MKHDFFSIFDKEVHMYSYSTKFVLQGFAVLKASGTRVLCQIANLVPNIC